MAFQAHVDNIHRKAGEAVFKSNGWAAGTASAAKPPQAEPGAR